MIMLMHMDQAFASSHPDRQPAGWTGNGHVFYVRDKADLAENWLPLFFSDKIKFKSFTRKLYRWGFRQVSVPDGAGVVGSVPPTVLGSAPAATCVMTYYYNAHFQRDKKSLLTSMRSVTAATKRKEQRDQHAFQLKQAQAQVNSNIQFPKNVSAVVSGSEDSNANANTNQLLAETLVRMSSPISSVTDDALASATAVTTSSMATAPMIATDLSGSSYLMAIREKLNRDLALARVGLVMSQHHQLVAMQLGQLNQRQGQQQNNNTGNLIQQVAALQQNQIPITSLSGHQATSIHSLLEMLRESAR